MSSPPLNEVMRRLLDATSGSMGAVLVSVLLYPVDIAKTKIQAGHAQSTTVSGALQDILATEGLYGLFKGVGIKSFHSGFQVRAPLPGVASLCGRRRGPSCGVVCLLTGRRLTFAPELHLLLHLRVAEGDRQRAGRAAEHPDQRDIGHDGGHCQSDCDAADGDSHC